MLDPAEKGRSRRSSVEWGEDVRGGEVVGSAWQAHSCALGAAGAMGAEAGAIGEREQFGPEQGAGFFKGWAGGVEASATGARRCTIVR